MSSIQPAKVSFASVLAIFLVFSCIYSVAQMTSVGINCSRIGELGIDRQANLRAATVVDECGSNYDGAADTYDLGWAGTEPLRPRGIKNVLVSTAKCTSSNKCERNSSVVWASSADGGQTLVDNYNDFGTDGYSGTSYSKDGGAKFVEIKPAPFNSGHGTNFGDPIEVFDAKLKTWFAGDLTSGCGGQGIGLWTSGDGVHWKTGACAHNGSADDSPSMWVDNETTSGTYGRMYVSLNDFVKNGALTVLYSDDGNTWSTPVILATTPFIRSVQLTGSPVGAKRYEGANSTVFVIAMDEGGGGQNTRQNIIFKSLDGGSTWTSTPMGRRFNPPGDRLCSQDSYWVVILPIWRTQGWGQGGVGPKGVVHYAYAGSGSSKGDIGDIFYVRSTDNGRTWSKAIKLNTDMDNARHTQWMPSLTADKDARITVVWYDRRAATSACVTVGDSGCNYERVGRQSNNNGISFGSEITISSKIIQQPTGVSCFAGGNSYDTTLNGKVYDGWTDGRVMFQGENVQNVEFAIPVGKW